MVHYFDHLILHLELQDVGDCFLDEWLSPSHFNLDLNKENELNYGKRPFFEDMNNYLGHHHLEQLILEDTWSQIIKGNNVSSRIDHI